jgi:hypothetical protein
MKFGSKETPLKSRLKIRHYLKYITLLLDTHLEEKALLVPKKVPKAIPKQWDYLSTSQVNFKPQNQEMLPTWHNLTLAMKKESMFQVGPICGFSRSLDLEKVGCAEKS